MKWFKRILISLVGLLVGLSLIIFSVKFILGESHYKQIMIWAAEQYFDSELIIEGPIKVDISSNFKLEAGNLKLIAKDDSFQLTTSSVQFTLRMIPYLRKGIFWFDNINLENTQLKLFETNRKYNELTIPVIFIQHANVNNFTITYQEQAPESLHSFTFDELTIHEIGENNPATLHATGKLKEESFFLELTADSFAQAIEGIDSYNVKLNFNSPILNLNLIGSIMDPINGHGLNLNIDVDVPNVTEIMEILWDDVPLLGHLQGAFTLRGDYTAPKFDDVDINLLQTNEVDLTVTGSVINALKGEGLDLQFEASINNQDVINWLFSHKYEPIHMFNVRGQIYGDIKQITLRNLIATAVADDDVQVNAMGEVEVHATGYRLKKSDAKLKVEFKAPNLSAINLPNVDRLPKLGPVLGKLDLAVSRDAIAIYNTKVTMGQESTHQIFIAGDVGYVQLFEPLVLSELNLQTNLQTKNITQLGQKFGYTLPNFGPATLQGKLIAQGSEIILQDTNLQIGSETKFQASGLLATKLRKLKDYRIDLDMKVEAMEVAQLGKQFNYEIPELGPLRLQGKLSSQDSKLLLQNTRVVLGTGEKYLLHANGIASTQIEDLKNFNVDIDIDIQSNEISQLAAMFEYRLPKLGSTHITGRLESSDNEINFNNGVVVIGEVNQPSSRINFEINTQKQKGSTVTAQFETAIASWTKKYSGKFSTNLGYANGEVEFSSLDGEWGIESFSVVSTDSDLIQFEFSGKYDDMENYDDAQINTSLAIKNPEKFGNMLGLNLRGIGPINQQGQLSINKARLQYDSNLSIGETKSKNKITGYLKDGKPILSGSFNMETLYLADLGIAKSDIETSPKQSIDKPRDSYIFSPDKFDLGFFNKFNFDYTVNINEIRSEQFAIQRLQGKLKLEDGNFAAPLSLVYEDGNADINLKIKQQNTPEYSLTVITDDIQLGPLLSQYQSEIPIRGYTNIDLNLNAHGNSFHAIASSLSGSVNIGVENARIPNVYLEYLFVDVMGWVISRTGLKRSHSNLNCVVMLFNIDDGMIESDTIILDGQNLTIGGQIDMNLKDETLDIVLIPKQKGRVFASTTPVKITGPILNPEVNAIPVAAALKEIGQVGGVVLFSSVFVPLKLGEKLWSLLRDGDKAGGGCEKIEAQLNEAQ